MLFFETIFAGSCGPTGIENPLANEAFLNVYPNPANDKITVKLGSVSEKAYAEIYNSVGQLVKTAVPVMGTEAELNISDLARGIYIVRVVNGNEVSNIKIAVEK
jgi:hypothetical protein